MFDNDKFGEEFDKVQTHEEFLEDLITEFSEFYKEDIRSTEFYKELVKKENKE